MQAPRTPASFTAAKRRAAAIYADHRETFYCSCSFSAEGLIEARGCGYRPRGRSRTSQRLTWEHVVPASAFGSQRSCWRDRPCLDRNGRRLDGRACCRKIDDEFRRMEADLHNLVPAIGELNQARAHFTFGTVTGEPRAFGQCDFEIDVARQTAELPASRRGDVARAYLYMNLVYPEAFRLSGAERARLEAWHHADPPDAWERTRNARIAAEQGVANPFVGR